MEAETKHGEVVSGEKSVKNWHDEDDVLLKKTQKRSLPI